MAFHVGQKVECIDADGTQWPGALKVGQIYVVLSSPCSEYGDPYIEVNASGGTGCKSWLSRRFRAVVESKPDISIFTEMLKPKQRELVSP